MKKEEITEKLNKQLAGISKAEIRAANLEVYPRLVAALYERSASCSTCKELYDKSLVYADDIVPVLRGPKEKGKEFEQFVNEALMHLHQKHKTLPKGKILSVSVLVGMLLGLSIAVIAGYFINENIMQYGALGWLIGTLAGWITGKIRERNLKEKNRIF